MVRAGGVAWRSLARAHVRALIPQNSLAQSGAEFSAGGSGVARARDNSAEPFDVDDGRVSRHVGVPYGSHARLIMLHLQSEGLKSRTVSLGPSLSAFLRSLGLPVSGGPRGSIVATSALPAPRIYGPRVKVAFRCKGRGMQRIGYGHEHYLVPGQCRRLGMLDLRPSFRSRGVSGDYSLHLPFRYAGGGHVHNDL